MCALPSRILSALRDGRYSATVAASPGWVGAFMAWVEFGAQAVGALRERVLMRSSRRKGRAHVARVYLEDLCL